MVLFKLGISMAGIRAVAIELLTRFFQDEAFRSNLKSREETLSHPFCFQTFRKSPGSQHSEKWSGLLGCCGAISS